MLQSTTASLTTASVGLVLIAAFTLPASIRTYRRFAVSKQNYEYIDKYEDEDGVATEESQSAFSTLIQTILIIVSALVGNAVSLAGAIIALNRADARLPIETWLQFASWILLTIQAISILIAPAQKEQFKLGIHGFFSSLLLITAVVLENVFIYSDRHSPQPYNLHITLTAVQLGAAFLFLITTVSIPRRPDVYIDNGLVDRMRTTSILGRFSFAWTNNVLTRAGKAESFEVTDLPKVHHHNRAKTLRERWDKTGLDDPVWKRVLKAHLGSFTVQLVLSGIVNVTNFGPQLVLFSILKTLEQRDAGLDVTAQLWGLAVALGFAIAATSWIEAWLYWISFGGIGIPIFEQLAAVIFSKATRRKDVKGVGQKKEEAKTNGKTVVNEGAGQKGEDVAVKKADDEDEDDNELAQKTKQSTINLIAVDAKRISDFAAFNHIFLGSVVKLVVAIIFLVKLIGWIPLLCGFVIPVFVVPVNILAAKRYAAAQDKLMKTRDSKMAVVTEALQGIRQIKFSALERQWQKKIMDVRSTELNTQWRVFLYDTTLIAIWILGPVLLAAVSLTVYALIHRELNASIAFTAISVFDSIEMVLAVIPELVTEFLDSKISADRINKYLYSPDRGENTVDGDSVKFSTATIAWPSDDGAEEENRFTLRDLNIEFPTGELSVISGKTGSGKSLLLSAILGEVDVVSGTLTVPKAPLPAERHDDQANKSNWTIPSSIAYVSQIPWIENASIKDNILFGLPDDQDRYAKVKKVCALEKDLEMLTDGELTDIGANGINLSGGQKWRVSFARALYSRAGILVLDDIFSAVDAHVGRHLYEQALIGELGKGRTRILVTHHVALCLPGTKYSVLLEDGKAQHSGTIEELRRSGSLKNILEHDIHEHEEEAPEDEEDTVLIDDGGGLSKVMTNASKRSRRDSRRKSFAENGANRDAVAKKADKPKQFNEEEKREKGSIKLKIYKNYLMSSGGPWYWSWIAMVFVLSMLVILSRSGWITLWTRSYAKTESHPQFNTFLNQNMVHYTKERFHEVAIDHNLAYYLGIYVGISIFYCIICSSRYFFVFWASITASKVLFENLTYAVIRAPLRWLDTVPVGRILNRFTGDFNMLDSRVAMDLAFLLNHVMNLLSVLIAGFFVSPWMILFATVLMVICLRFAVRYLAGAREVKRLESTLKSPVYELFGSTLVGIGTIRAFDKVGTFITRMYSRIDQHNQAYWHLWLFNRWLGFRLNMAGAIFSVITAFLIVSIDGVDASLAGFALSFSLEYTFSLTFCLRQYANVELEMNAAERIIEYSNIPIEKQEGESAPAAWPTEGKLEVDNLVVGYAPELPPVLKGLTFSVDRNQRVGVVGRTGAGKSSLTLALFRFLEAREGSIHIDGIDISKITLYDLRSRLAIIPQDPVLFSGTVRSNLDAFDEHTDIELRDALQRVHLISNSGSTTPHATSVPTSEPSSSSSSTSAADKNTNIFHSLTSRISEGGLNLSQGQRQLLCLARAIVSRPKIMVLDEATSAVDMATDALIQRSIREEFTDSTLVVIAHRLSTIADFDRILVMGEGKVVEFDEPRNLMKIEGGVFRGMVEESGEREILEGIIFGDSKRGGENVEDDGDKK
ncbi:putative abc bile acid transporter [Phaeomoniella chlamydospora]|uniref:Putative abc bile acid transporter n=1 Tax=Phaeomoniella chlamydospora TaxID=158046 RepID=A0A0G2EQT5_PHACM|nr:putative abc bile acid transporter [Phaeomoniella chlamydospora]